MLTSVSLPYCGKTGPLLFVPLLSEAEGMEDFAPSVSPRSAPASSSVFFSFFFFLEGGGGGEGTGKRCEGGGEGRGVNVYNYNMHFQIKMSQFEIQTFRCR